MICSKSKQHWLILASWVLCILLQSLLKAYVVYYSQEWLQFSFCFGWQHICQHLNLCWIWTHTMPGNYLTKMVCMFAWINTFLCLPLAYPACIFASLALISYHDHYHLHNTLQLEYHQLCQNIMYIFEQCIYLLWEPIACQCCSKWQSYILIPAKWTRKCHYIWWSFIKL